jgi:hypothetical protein
VAGELGVGTSRTASEPVARRPQSLDRSAPLGGAQLVGLRESDRARHVLRAGAAMALLLAAVLLGQDVGPVLDVERADALGAFELVAADRDEVDAELADRRSTYGAAWIASTWNRIPFRARTLSAISAIGWSVPTSLFASMIETGSCGRTAPRRARPDRRARIDPLAARRPRTRTSRGSEGHGRPRDARSTT